MLLNILNQLKIITPLFLLLLCILGCKVNSNCQTSGKNAAAPPLLQIQKTPCYGPCPAYEATVMENGMVTFVGWDNVPVSDTVQMCFTEKEMNELKKAIEKLDYTSLQTSYGSQWTDIPTTYLTFYQNGKQVKRIKHQKGGPEALVTFQKNLNDKLLELVGKEAQQP
ncbi:DUF6438 domain-containing protein [Pontibacter sp. MBLB2868]|uniref:DUF6438 domain-containing protein n=1 Tax=Pontibacter sp. MBLB2868 TaxID=3451555 RepID=UPI003F754F40